MYLYDDQAREKLANKIIDFLKGKKLLWMSIQESTNKKI